MLCQSECCAGFCVGVPLAMSGLFCTASTAAYHYWCPNFCQSDSLDLAAASTAMLYVHAVTCLAHSYKSTSTRLMRWQKTQPKLRSMVLCIQQCIVVHMESTSEANGVFDMPQHKCQPLRMPCECKCLQTCTAAFHAEGEVRHVSNLTFSRYRPGSH